MIYTFRPVVLIIYIFSWTLITDNYIYIYYALHSSTALFTCCETFVSNFVSLAVVKCFHRVLSVIAMRVLFISTLNNWSSVDFHKPHVRHNVECSQTYFQVKQ